MRASESGICDFRGTCPEDHEPIHKRVEELLKGYWLPHLRSRSASQMVSMMEVPARKAAQHDNAFYVFNAVHFIEALVSTIFSRLQEGTMSKKDFLNVLDCIHNRFLLVAPMSLFVLDLNQNLPASCLVTRGINQAIINIKDLIVQSPINALLASTFRQHIRRIHSGELDVEDVAELVAVHNLAASIVEIGAERRLFCNCECVSYLSFDFLQDTQKFTLSKILKDEIVDTFIIHPSFFKLSHLLPDVVKMEWRSRVSLSPMTRSCQSCSRTPRNKADVGVMSGCSCLLCIECLDTFVHQQFDIKCPNCWKTSLDYIPASGFNRFLSTLQ